MKTQITTYHVNLTDKTIGIRFALLDDAGKATGQTGRHIVPLANPPQSLAALTSQLDADKAVLGDVKPEALTSALLQLTDARKAKAEVDAAAVAMHAENEKLEAAVDALQKEHDTLAPLVQTLRADLAEVAPAEPDAP